MKCFRFPLLGKITNIRKLVIFFFFAIFVQFLGCSKDKDKSPINPENGNTSYESIFHKGDSDSIILFVHGLYGNPEETFAASNSAVSWPTLITTDKRSMKSGPLLSEYSIKLISYPASRSDPLSIEQIATRLVTDLEDENIFSHFEKIYFITHSLGGLVTKELILKLNSDNSEAVKKIKSVFLIGVPSQGAPAANFLKRLPKIFGNLVVDLSVANMNYLRSLENRWKSFLRHRKQGLPKIFCAYETRSTFGIKVVPEVYTSTTCDEEARPETTDHINIVKPTGIDNSIYGWVRGRIANISAELEIELKGKVFTDHLKDGSLGPKMVWIPAGSFRMGDIQAGGSSDEKPVHKVSVSHFAMGRYEVTFTEYDKFVKATGRTKPSNEGWGRGNQPVINVSWYDAVAYTQWLSRQTGKKYRLPTEAEWEYAARAGTTTKYWWGNDVGRNQANCHGCGSSWGNKQTAPVGSFEPNLFGIYDTVGNVWEWVHDWHSDSYSENSLSDPKGPSTGSGRVFRGGGWRSSPQRSRAAARGSHPPSIRFNDTGFRLLRQP